MATPLTGVKAVVDELLRKQLEAEVETYRPGAKKVLEGLRKKLLQAPGKGESRIFVMSWLWAQDPEEEIEGLTAMSCPLPRGNELAGVERLVYDACCEEGFKVSIEAPEPSAGAETRYLNMYVMLS